jgi:hypothetical protein
MIHDATAKTDMITRRKNRSRRLTDSSDSGGNSLENRVAWLETRVEQLQVEIDGLAGVMPRHFPEAAKASWKRRPGPSERMDGTELLLRRDDLVHWLEDQWPNMVSPLLAARNPRQVASVLRAIASARHARPEWQRDFVGHPATLMNLLQSDEFRKKPPKRPVIDALCSANLEQRRRAANRFPTRQIANAMAGVPRLKWRTSLDRCSKTPCTARVGYETMRHYRTQVEISRETQPLKTV